MLFLAMSRKLGKLCVSRNSADQFVSKLGANAGGVLSASEKSNLISLLNGNPISESLRAQVLRSVAEDQTLKDAETNRAFVLMQYFGYMRRNPFDPPDAPLVVTTSGWAS